MACLCHTLCNHLFRACTLMLCLELLPQALLAFHRHRLLQAEADLAAILTLACAPLDKATACERGSGGGTALGSLREPGSGRKSLGNGCTARSTTAKV